ncbi:MAG: ATP/cobalamin adenosyltransferase [Phycisphaerales bacterium]|nr:ATP/cobalamin adenosyltransferase [Phycisphaerales bacterium]
MKIYTKTGDDGSTGLIGGSRVRKSDRRIECYGTVDELNAAIGLAVGAVGAVGAGAAANAGHPMIPPAAGAVADPPAPDPLADLVGPLRAVQADLFTVGSHLATPDENPHKANLPPLDEQMVSRLEMGIDAAEAELPPLRTFVLPGGTEAAARLHLARTVCRRAERLLVDFAMDRPVPSIVLTYLNRLSDWLFVLARLCNHRCGVADIPWTSRR